MKTERVGFAFCGSFCTHEQVLRAYDQVTGQYETVIPIVSEISPSSNTRFGKAENFITHIETAAGRQEWKALLCNMTAAACTPAATVPGAYCCGT